MKSFKESYYEEKIMEAFSEMNAGRQIQKWLKKTQTVVVNQDFTNNFIATKYLLYKQYQLLVQWCVENNVVIVDRKFHQDVLKNLSFKLNVTSS